MTLSDFAMRNKVIVTITVIILMGWGTVSYLNIPRRENPEFTITVAVVSTAWPGTPAEIVEELVTAPLEEEISSLENLRRVYSETYVGQSTIFVELSRTLPNDQVKQMWDDVRSRVDRVPMPAPHLKPIVMDEFGDESVMLFAVYQKPAEGESEVDPANRYSYRDLEIFANRLQDELRLLDGVARVDLSGVRQEAIYVEIDRDQYSQIDLRASELENLLESRNVIAPGGSIDATMGRFSVKPSGDLAAEQEIRSLVVGSIGEGEGATPVYLNDLQFKVQRTYRDPPKSYCRYGEPGFTSDAVIVHYVMEDGANVTKVNAATIERARQLVENEKIFPPDLAITPVINAAETVNRKIDDFVVNVVQAILIVVGIIYLIVGFRSSSVMAANIPLVIIGTIAIIPLFGVQMEQISLAAMIIALGLLVDNAVQVCDQCRRLQTEGKSPFQAAREGANEVAAPIFIATMTTVAAFYPMLLGLKGTTKEYIYSLPVTISVVLLLSYVLAMTFCVMLAAWFIRAPKHENESLSPVIQLLHKFRKPKPRTGDSLYAKFSRVALRLKWIVVVGGFALLGLTLTLPVGSEFFPKDVRDQFAVEVWLPESVAIHETDEATKRVEELVRKLSPTAGGRERLRNYRVLVGGGGARWYLGRNPEAMQPNYAELIVKVSDSAFTSEYAAEIRRVALTGDPERGIEPLPGIRVVPRELVMGPAVKSPIEMRIFGPRLGTGFADEAIMRRQAAELVEIFREHPGTWDVRDSWGAESFQIRVDIDTDMANLAGVTNASVARTLNSYFSGHQLTTYREDDHQIPVYLRLPREQRGDIQALSGAHVEGARGKVPLESIARVQIGVAPAKLERRFYLRKIDILAKNEDGYLSNDIVNDVVGSQRFKEWEANLPPGYWWRIGGDLFESNLTKADLSFSLIISMLAIILLLVIQFNGIVKPVIILATLPLAIIGAYLGLFVSGYPLGFMPQLGLLSLFGIIINAGIIYIDFADRLIADKRAAGATEGPYSGLTKEEFRGCLVKAGEVRLLPIAMTTLTTIAGFIPLATGGGPLWAGMSWLMIFGLAVGTVLTLVVVPSLYAIFVETFRFQPLPTAGGDQDQ
ncbi:MAG: efflux RND transporter permease subunit [Planctomycetota bacterium]